MTREEAYENEIEYLHNRLDIAEHDKERLREEVTRLEEKIKTLEQAPKTGKWISRYKCPICGAKMVDYKESEE